MAKRKPIDVALAVQGGGAHGAFSWGVLDRLLDAVAANEINITALSGTSAGGFNATLAAYGLGRAKGAEGVAEAKRLLAGFWLEDAHLAPFSVYTATAALWHGITGTWNIDESPVVLASDLMGMLSSPYGAPAIEWLKIAAGKSIDFEELQTQTDGPELYITATNIRHNRRDIFARSAVTFDVLAASGSLPAMFQARTIEIDGEEQYYWDGGYMGNPALSPLTSHCQDIIVIQINPFERPDSPPKTPSAIYDRLNEITFNSSLVLELSAIAAANQNLPKPNHLHAITDEPYMISLGNASKLVIIKDFLEELRDRGRATADAWLANPARGGQLGQQSTLATSILQRIITNQTIIRKCPTSGHPRHTRVADKEMAPPSAEGGASPRVPLP